MRTVVWSELDERERAALLARPALADDERVRARVAAIIASVRADGDAALRALTAELDGVTLDSLEVSAGEFTAAERELDASARAAIRTAAANIEKFHRAQRAQAVSIETAAGVRCERVHRPIGRVGLYVPAGTAPLPSTALMLGIPASIAACNTRVLCSPPQRKTGRIDSAVLYAARIAGVQRVFKLGGAQAIAALAYGTESVPKVEKIFGPGNTWVTEAKAQVDRDPAGATRDFPAGPSEVLVIADGDANPAFIASDLLSQAEHGADSQVLLLTTSARLAAAVVAEVEAQTAKLPRRALVAGALAHSSVIVVADVPQALELSNRYAPEHLILQVAEPRRWLADVESAGSVFLGPWTPESLGDYCSGTNHVLPTYGFARSYSSLGLDAFLRSMTVQEATPEGLRNLGPVAETLAKLEGLDAHARAVTQRLEALGTPAAPHGAVE